MCLCVCVCVCMCMHNALRSMKPLQILDFGKQQEDEKKKENKILKRNDFLHYKNMQNSCSFYVTSINRTLCTHTYINTYIHFYCIWELRIWFYFHNKFKNFYVLLSFKIFFMRLLAIAIADALVAILYALHEICKRNILITYYIYTHIHCLERANRILKRNAAFAA